MVYAIVLQTLKQNLAYTLHEVIGWESIVQASIFFYIRNSKRNAYLHTTYIVNNDLIMWKYGICVQTNASQTVGLLDYSAHYGMIHN